MKNFIRDEGKVRICSSNKAKMNIIEWIFYNRYLLKERTLDTLRQIYDGLCLLTFGLINLLIIILFPITFPIAAYLSIRAAKKDVKSQKRL